MPLLKTVKPEDASGVVKDVYDGVAALARTVPRPLEMASTSPDLLRINSDVLKYYLGHKTLSFPLLAHIRYAVASHLEYDYCIEFNSSLLTMWLGVSDEQLEAIKKDPARANLEEKEKALFEFVVNAVKNPSGTSKADVEHLQLLGWDDKDIYDALYHGINMVPAGIAFKALKMNEE